ncbi:lysophospholipase [Sphingobium indicum IP26]|uniref:Lysophospholipase n=1 Tax=Sphingobium indicum F2 TaxID=1450518 RepID=A0A8E0WS42_9SPHN|nr:MULTISPECIES: GDSL-type esterase/lipase family protein [Sphingobium]EPR18930.1 lysophospholipase [Sphingobium indicum IP26]EQB00177.1 lysophospholipase [Sphingobium sp. HDIP04]KER36372.1 lysophospholipase [Sphingobium indicum F2]
MKTPLLQRLDASPLAKCGLAILIFCLIVGGWLAVGRYQAAHVTLPDEGARQGACSLWFVGSSSMHRWTSLSRDMAPWDARNRGMDDATFAEILPRFANAAKDNKPAAIILYAGENDIASGVEVRAVVHDLGRFLDLRNRMMGDVPVLILSMKPSPTRRSILGSQMLFNAAARRLIERVPLTYYGDITTPLLEGGKLGDNYRADGVHMNPAGYRIWAKVVRQRLDDILPPETVRRCAR